MNKIKKLKELVEEYKKEYGEEERTGIYREELVCECGNIRTKSCCGDEEWESIVVVGGEALEKLDAERFVELAPAAGLLARVDADAPEDAREGHLLAYHGQSLGVHALCNEIKIAWDVDVGRTGIGAGHHISLPFRDGAVACLLVDEGPYWADLHTGEAMFAAGLGIGALDRSCDSVAIDLLEINGLNTA